MNNPLTGIGNRSEAAHELSPEPCIGGTVLAGEVALSVSTTYSASKLFRKIKGIIFDFDGTLFDTTNLPFFMIAAFPFDIFRIRKERLIRKRFAGRDYSTPEKYYRDFFAEFGKACCCPPLRVRNWYFNRYLPRMVKVLKKHYKLRPWVKDIIQRLDPGEGSNTKALPSDFPKLAIYSDYPLLKERLEAMGVSPGRSVLLYGPETFGAQKPAARPFLSIAGDLGAAPEEILVVGDREETDGLGAFHAGMRFFCLETGRKRYYRLDPNRRPPEKDKEPNGPSLLMYAGTWDDLIGLFMEKYGKPNNN